MIIAAILPLLSIQFGFRGVIPGQDHPDQLFEEEIYWVMNVMVCFVLNQNTFKVTLFTFPLIHLVFYVLQLQVQYFGEYHPYTGEPLTLKGSINICIQRMVVFAGVELLIVYNNYMTQRDLIT
jgi:hypothetical protein